MDEKWTVLLLNGTFVINQYFLQVSLTASLHRRNSSVNGIAYVESSWVGKITASRQTIPPVVPRPPGIVTPIEY
jgi:hypothetical protein